MLVFGGGGVSGGKVLRERERERSLELVWKFRRTRFSLIFVCFVVVDGGRGVWFRWVGVWDV